VSIVERLICQVKGDPTSCEYEQSFHGAEFERKTIKQIRTSLVNAGNPYDTEAR
jgi:hypothetical protein